MQKKFPSSYLIHKVKDLCHGFFKGFFWFLAVGINLADTTWFWNDYLKVALFYLASLDVFNWSSPVRPTMCVSKKLHILQSIPNFFPKQRIDLEKCSWEKVI